MPKLPTSYVYEKLKQPSYSLLNSAVVSVASELDHLSLNATMFVEFIWVPNIQFSLFGFPNKLSGFPIVMSL